MKLKTYFTLAVASLVFIAGCKKEKDSNTIDPSQLVGKTWKKTAETYSPAVDFDNNGTFETNTFVLLPACETDNVINFTTSTDFTLDEGAAKCNALNPQTTAGTWAWNSNQTAITVTIGSFNQALTVLTLNSTTLAIQQPDTINSTASVSTQTFTAQ